LFTGIIREVGHVRELVRTGSGARLRVEAPGLAPTLRDGGSIAVDGVCVTVTGREGSTFQADIIPETLHRTRFETLAKGASVNLEPPLTLESPIDGHLVQGHVDGRGEVVSVTQGREGHRVTVRAPEELAPFFAEKGSVAVNGVSLTVAETRDGTFTVALIPKTLKSTNLNDLMVGSHVNLEVDLFARYVARLRGLEDSEGEKARFREAVPMSRRRPS
jgi:riboflavin synthase